MLGQQRFEEVQMNEPVTAKHVAGANLTAVCLVSVVTMLAGCTTVENRAPMVEVQQDSTSGNGLKKINHYLADLLRKHGVKNVEESDQGVTVPNSKIQFKGCIYGLNQSKNGVTAELEIKLVLPDGRELVEYPAGGGKDADAAVGLALANFCISTFDPIYGAFFNNNDEHVLHETWTIGGQSRRVYVGNGVQMMFGKPGQKAHNQQMSAKARDWWLSQYKEAISRQTIDGRDHWSKFFVAQAADRVIEREITFDNEAAPAMNELIAKQTCPIFLGSMYTVKQFIIIGKSEEITGVGSGQ
jgi:hypothetical protein